MSNKTIYKDTLRGFDITALQTDYGAIIMHIGHEHRGLSHCSSWWGGIVDLDDAKRIAGKYHKEKAGDGFWGIVVSLCGLAYFWLGVMG